MKYYGSLDNRLEENKMYCDKIEVGTKMTEYSWSDRKPYEVVEVIDQKHIKVRELDHIKADDVAMSNNWKLVSNPNNAVREMEFRYGKWNFVVTITKESMKRLVMIDQKVYDKVMQEGQAKVYSKTNVSFGVAEYYYDYEF